MGMMNILMQLRKVSSMYDVCASTHNHTHKYPLSEGMLCSHLSHEANIRPVHVFDSHRFCVFQVAPRCVFREVLYTLPSALALIIAGTARLNTFLS